MEYKTILAYHLLWLLAYTSAFRVLLLPAANTDHVTVFMRLGEQLLSRGHDVTMLLPSSPAARSDGDVIPTGLHVRTFRLPITVTQSYLELRKDMIEVGQHYSSGKFIRTMRKVAELRLAEGKVLLKDNTTMKWLKENSFHFAIVDATLPPYLIVPYKLGLPYAIVTHECNPLTARVPYPPSFVPHGFLPYTDKMSFIQRLINTVLQSFLVLSNSDSDSELVSLHAPAREAVSLQVLEEEATLCMPIREGVFDFIRPSMPTIVPIGHVAIREGLPLPADLESFFVDSPDGVIVVSFGLWTEIIPKAVISKLLEAFAKIKTSIVWKYEGSPLADLPENVRIEYKVSLNDLLAHYKTRLCISECGLMGVIEAVSNGVPVLGLPIGLDQPSNCAVIKSREFGEVLPFASFMPKQLVESVLRILNQEAFSENVGTAALVTHEITTEFQERGAFWVEHVMLHGGRHLRSAASDLSWYQLYCIDVYICLTVFVTLTALTSITAVYLGIKLGIRKFTDEMALKEVGNVTLKDNHKCD